MSITINSNLAATSASLSMKRAGERLTKSLMRLSSGKELFPLQMMRVDWQLDEIAKQSAQSHCFHAQHAKRNIFPADARQCIKSCW